MYIRKSTQIGPTTVPWGTPDYSCYAVRSKLIVADGLVDLLSANLLV